ncbi:MAG: hypothetical protein ACM31E_04115 [Fibrobacterota bacterium]
MKKASMFLLLFFVSSSYAFDLSIDTINTGEKRPLYVNSNIDTIRFDSAKVELIKSEFDQYQIELACFFTNNTTGKPTGANSKGFHFWNHGNIDSNVNKFKLELGPNETVSLKIEGYDYCLVCIPENVQMLNSPNPLQAKMFFFTNKGVDSIIINGMQTNQPIPNAVIHGQKYNKKVSNGQNEYYTINGRLLNFPSVKKAAPSNVIGIAIEKYPDRSVISKKNLLTH